MNYAPRITRYNPDWSMGELPEVKDPLPMTALEFKRVQSALAMITSEDPYNRKAAGKEPLRAFHPIALRALPKLRSLGR